MISGITTTCFAASYAVAFLLELARLMLRHTARRVLTLGFAVAGLLAQTPTSNSAPRRTYRRSLNLNGSFGSKRAVQ